MPPRNSLHPLALAALAVGPAAVEASPVSPTFACADAVNPALGGSIDWGNKVSVAAPLLAILGNHKLGNEASSMLDCEGGSFGENIERKSGEGQKDFLKLTLKEAFANDFITPEGGVGGSHFKWTVSSSLGANLDGFQYYDTTWNLLIDYKQETQSKNTASGGLFSNFLGIKISTLGAFQGLDEVAFAYDAATQELSFLAPRQETDARLSLTAAPFAVPEPGMLAVLGTGLLGAAAAGARRKRRGW